MRASRFTHPAFLLLTITLAACQAIPGGRSSSPLSQSQDAPAPPPPPPTSEPGQAGLPGTQLAWEWQEDSRPSAIAVADGQLAVIASDGRFLWLDPETGQSLAGGFIWPDEIRGETWGSVSLAGGFALVTAVETFQPQLGDFPETRSRVAAFDAAGAEMWTLPELGDKHLYSATIGRDMALIGTHRGFDNNSLAAYDLAAGEIEWRYEAQDYGFEKLVADDERVYSALVDAEGGGMAAYDLRTGALVWASHDPTVRLADDVLLDGERLYALTQPAAVALNAASGQIEWTVEVGLAPEAGMVVRAPFLYVVPAPTADLSSRPGVLALHTGDGDIAWHALAGLVADPLAAGGEALWAVVKDPDAGTVSLSVLEAASGLERARLPIGTDVEEHYQLVAIGDTAYVLGDTLLAFRIPRP